MALHPRFPTNKRTKVEPKKFVYKYTTATSAKEAMISQNNTILI